GANVTAANYLRPSLGPSASHFGRRTLVVALWSSHFGRRTLVVALWLSHFGQTKV
ncbi:MAG: hypothetical protein ACI83Y_001341, partial [Candidatus Azotimanducaceae bacterium]